MTKGGKLAINVGESAPEKKVTNIGQQCSAPKNESRDNLNPKRTKEVNCTQNERHTELGH